MARTKFLLFLLLFSKISFSQNADINLLQRINPTNPNSQLWVNTSRSAYPLSLGIQGGLMAYDYFHSDSTRGRIPIHIAEKLVVLVVTDGLKYIINRPRPYTKYPYLINPYDASEKGLSFPSGHTSLAFNAAATISIRYPKWYVIIPSYLWASMVGYSRLYMGEHYPSDVLAGAAIGVGSAYLVQWIDKKLFPKTKKHLF